MGGNIFDKETGVNEKWWNSIEFLDFSAAASSPPNGDAIVRPSTASNERRQTNGVTPGRAIGGVLKSAFQSVRSGTSSSWEFIAISQVIC